MQNTAYTRGTKTVRIKTARLVPGDRVLTRSLLPLREDGTWIVAAAQTKTGAVVRTVERLEAVAGRSIGGHRAQRTYTVHFADDTRAEGNAPIYTWHAIAPEEA